ncbi:MAG: hypothetical protein OXE95_12075 [Chloroflexi bacterium]|nr:hypothetical protein [Chloroflexota bacterium]MCY4248298.1 hypothetical protein [Chloroflexota bacterium]
MRCLHPVQAHERFLAGGRYHFSKGGAPLQKSEAWTLHAHPDGEQFVRVDADSLREEGRSVLAEALLDQSGALARLDIRYENAQFPGGVRDLRATYQIADGCLQVGYELNGADRQYRELALPPGTLMDVPLLPFRGRTIAELAGRGSSPAWLFVPAFDYAQLLPGLLRQVASPVAAAGTETLRLGKRAIVTRRFRYHDKATAYWLDEHDVIVRRVNVFQQQEIVVQISDYVAPPRPRESATC